MRIVWSKNTNDYLWFFKQGMVYLIFAKLGTFESNIFSIEDLLRHI